MDKINRQIMKYFGKHPSFNSLVHLLGGIGIGFLLTYPVAGNHPVRWGLAFLDLSVLGHVWALQQTK